MKLYDNKDKINSPNKNKKGKNTLILSLYCLSLNKRKMAKQTRSVMG